MEALVLSMGLLTHMHLDSEKRVAEAFEEQRRRGIEADNRVSRLLDAIEGPARIVEIHKHRIKGLEGE